MSVRKETISVQVEELYALIEDYIVSCHPELPKGTDFEYTSKTKFLTFDVIRPGKRK